jgi:hypothetical protein
MSPAPAKTLFVKGIEPEQIKCDQYDNGFEYKADNLGYECCCHRVGRPSINPVLNPALDEFDN